MSEKKLIEEIKQIILSFLNNNELDIKQTEVWKKDDGEFVMEHLASFAGDDIFIHIPLIPSPGILPYVADRLNSLIRMLVTYIAAEPLLILRVVDKLERQTWVREDYEDLMYIDLEFNTEAEEKEDE